MNRRNDLCPCGSGKRYKACCGAAGDASRSSPSLLILDDYFPNLLAGFRIAEFNAHLEAFPELCILSSAKGFDDGVADTYFDTYPQFVGRVKKFWDQSLLREARLAYVTFLANADNYLPYLEHYKLPFVLQLYPGGNFGLNNPDSDAKLDRVCTSPLLRRVIATQTVTQNYIRERYRDRVKTDLILGAVYSPSYFEDVGSERSYFGTGKDQLDVCFAAYKYSDRAADKGYPEFIEAAHQLAAASEIIQFHVIGNVTPDDIDVAGLAGRIRFHGSLVTHDLRRLFREMDLIVSPNRPSLFYPGNFDGFPTGSVTEAALAGVGMVVSDPLRLNSVFPDHEAVAIIEPAASDIVARILHFIEHPARLARMAKEGQRISAQVFAPERQLGARREIIRAELRASDAWEIQNRRKLAFQITAQLTLEIKRVLGEFIPVDSGGGCPEQKAIYMANLIVDQRMQRTVEIGVYRGRSLVPQALAHKRTGGMVIGIDPYDSVAAQQADAPEQLVSDIRKWNESTDFGAILVRLQDILVQLELSPHAKLIRARSDDAVAQIDGPIDMLHIDGNHDTEFVRRDLANYVPLLRDGGYVIVADIDWESVSVCLGELDTQCVGISKVDTSKVGAWGVWRKFVSAGRSR